jgi:hypothetical protein
MKPKEIPSFYFFIGIRGTHEFLHLHVGTAQLPNSTTASGVSHGPIKTDKSLSKIKTFIAKNNVYRIGYVTSHKDIDYDSLRFLGPKHPDEKIIIPQKLADRSTGRGGYFYLDERLFLAMNRADVEDFLNTRILAKESKSNRKRIPDEVQMFVWNRDGGSCVKCGTDKNLAFDHIIPHSLGGSDTKRNLQILCDECNLRKGNRIGG